MEDFKRPNHPDFMDRMELKKAKWSGIRANSISDEVEFWVLGEAVRSVPTKDRAAVRKAYQEIFNLYPEQVKNHE